jgi:Domain of Unknown Function with PDB structure (DUF3857)
MSISTRYWPLLAATALLFAVVNLPSRAQNPPQTTESQAPAAKPDAKPDAAPAIPDTPAQIELLETKIRFENNGDSRKEVHTVVRINSELGARQFSHLNFNFNRAYEKVEIPLVHITHKSGGSADILPSAITDQPNPVVGDAAAYQDVRTKSIRILGLEPSDVLEYRVITTMTQPPFAPNFWLDHNFDRTGVVTKETFDLDLPARRFTMPLGPNDPLPTPVDPTDQNSPAAAVGQIRISPQTPETSKNQPNTHTDPDARLVYRWEIASANLPKVDANLHASDESDVVVTTFSSWEQLQRRLQSSTRIAVSTMIFMQESQAMKNSAVDSTNRTVAHYNLVSTKVHTIDLPLDLGRFGKRKMEDVLSSGAGTPEDKILLYYVLSRSQMHILAVAASDAPEKLLPRPSLFTQLVAVSEDGKRSVYADPSLEVAPFGMIRPDLRGKKALDLSASCSPCWKTITGELPFSSTQRVNVDATIAPDGTLNAKVKYSMRGDNELLLRIAFHQSPRDKWKEVAQLMSLSDGFRGKVLSVSASDPLATKNAFTVEYEISQPKFVDWSKKPVRIAAPLPVLTVPDLPGKMGGSEKPAPIDLGMPLDVDTRVTLHLPAGTSVEIPTGTVVDRDYATFVSRYNTDSGTVTANRHINFLRRQVAVDRTPDYAAFLHAVQTDQAQLLTLTRADATTPPTTEAKTNSSKP